jgi:pimeloyl-ACP methyl ester carboxylesterase
MGIALHEHHRIDIGEPLAGAGPLQIAAQLFAPARPLSPLVFFCLPGGSLTGGYFNLQPEDGDQSFSFAAQMAARGFITVILDHLGIGASSQPADCYALTPDLLAAANAQAMATIGDGLRTGGLSASLPALPELVSVGVGHSMGAMLTALQQAQHRQHAALVLLGFGSLGLVEYLTPEQARYADDPVATRADIVRLAKLQFGDRSYPQLNIENGNAAAIYGGGADKRAVVAQRQARAPMLPVPALFSMIPGAVAPEVGQLDVPVFLGIGDRDLCPAHAVPAAFHGCPDLTLVVLAQTGHNHFLFASRERLFSRIDSWARTVVAGR